MATDWARISKFAGMLGSAGDGEVVAAARMIERALKAQGLTMGDLVNRIAEGEKYNPTGAARTKAERAQSQRRERQEQDDAWEERMRQEEEKARQGSARARRTGREW